MFCHKDLWVNMVVGGGGWGVGSQLRIHNFFFSFKILNHHPLTVLCSHFKFDFQTKLSDQSYILFIYFFKFRVHTSLVWFGLVWSFSSPQTVCAEK